MEPAHPGVRSFFLTIDGYPLTMEAIKSLMDRLAVSSGVKRLHLGVGLPWICDINDRIVARYFEYRVSYHFVEGASGSSPRHAL